MLIALPVNNIHVKCFFSGSFSGNLSSSIYKYSEFRTKFKTVQNKQSFIKSVFPLATAQGVQESLNLQGHRPSQSWQTKHSY